MLFTCIHINQGLQDAETAIPPGLLNPISVSSKHIKGAELEEQAEQSVSSEIGAEEAQKEVLDSDTSKGEIVSEHSFNSINTQPCKGSEQLAHVNIWFEFKHFLKFRITLTSVPSVNV